MNCSDGERYVGFFDIIGFKSWVAIDGSKSVFEYIKGYLDMMIKQSLPGAIVNSDLSVEYEVKYVDYVFFSDSIVFYSKDNSYESLHSLITACNSFMNVFISGVSYLTRGGIAYGEFYSDMETNSYVGQALIDAYILEENIDWLGVCFDKSIEQTAAFNKFKVEYPHLIFKSLTPLKSSNEYPYSINWADNEKLEDGTIFQLPEKYERLNQGISFNSFKSLDDCLTRRITELNKLSSLNHEKTSTLNIDNEINKLKLRIDRTVEFIRHCETKIKQLV